MSRNETAPPDRAANHSPRPGGATTELYPTKTRIALLNDIQNNRVNTDLLADHDLIWLFPNAPDQWYDRTRVTARVRELEQAGWVSEVEPVGGWVTTRLGRTVLNRALGAAVAEVAPAAAVPSQGQDIPDDQLAAILATTSFGNFGLSPYQLACVQDLVRYGYRVGYAAALGYQIQVTDAGVEIGDRGPVGYEKCEQPIQPGEAFEEQPGTGGLVQHLACPNWSPPNLVDRSVPDVWAGIRDRVEGGQP